MDPVSNEKPADGSSPPVQPVPAPGVTVPMPMPGEQPPAYNPEWTAPSNIQYAPGGVPPAGSQAAYPPPAQGGYPPPAQGGYPPLAQGSVYPPPQGSANPSTQYHYPGYGQQHPATVTSATTSHIIVRVPTCPKCETGVINEQFTACGILCAICFFPFGLLCCLAMRERVCSHCHSVF